MKALAPSASLAPAATAAVKVISCCSSAGKGPATSRPGAVSTLVRNTPSSASPRATASMSCAGPFWTLVLAFTGSPMPKRSKTLDLGAGRALRYGGDGPRREQRPLQRFGRRDVGLCGPRADRDPETDAGDVGGRPGDEPGSGGCILEHLAGSDAEVERASARGQLDQFRGGAEAKDDSVARRALELRAELLQRSRHAAA